MTSHIEVLRHLRPDGGYVSIGDDYAGITFIEAEPFSKAEYEQGFEQVKALKEQAANKKAAAEAKLAALGLTADDLKALGLG